MLVLQTGGSCRWWVVGGVAVVFGVTAQVRQSSGLLRRTEPDNEGRVQAEAESKVERKRNGTVHQNRVNGLSMVLITAVGGS